MLQSEMYFFFLLFYFFAFSKKGHEFYGSIGIFNCCLSSAKSRQHSNSCLDDPSVFWKKNLGEDVKMSVTVHVWHSVRLPHT